MATFISAAQHGWTGCRSRKCHWAIRDSGSLLGESATTCGKSNCPWAPFRDKNRRRFDEQAGFWRCAMVAAVCFVCRRRNPACRPLSRRGARPGRPDLARRHRVSTVAAVSCRAGAAPVFTVSGGVCVCACASGSVAETTSSNSGAGTYGKPYAMIDGRADEAAFNVSHSHGHGLIAFGSDGLRLGVDVETRRARDTLRLASESVFGKCERDALAGLFRMGLVRPVLPSLDRQGGIDQGTGDGVFAQSAQVRGPARRSGRSFVVTVPLSAPSGRSMARGGPGGSPASPHRSHWKQGQTTMRNRKSLFRIVRTRQFPSRRKLEAATHGLIVARRLDLPAGIGSEPAFVTG